MVCRTVIDRRAALARIGNCGVALLTLRSEVLDRLMPDKKGSQNPVAALNDRSRKILQTVLGSPQFSGEIPANKVRELADSESKDVAGVMLALLPVAQTYSRPPISNYHVGAIARGLSGSLYPGMNIEIPGQSLGFSVHGEQAALSNAYMHAERGVAAIAVTAAPCGHCRQFMNEMSPDGDIEVVVKGKPALKLSLLLPMAFGPKDLGFKDGAFPVRSAALVLPRASDDKLTQAALDAAGRAYAPYSQSPSGVAIGTKKGRIYKGSYIENAAFNPSLSPLQTALVQLILAGEDYPAISRVVLLEIKDAKISQESVTKAALSAIAPATQFEAIHAARS